MTFLDWHDDVDDDDNGALVCCWRALRYQEYQY